MATLAKAKSTLIHPTGARVLVRETVVRETPGGLALPDTAEQRPGKGVVVAVGPGRRWMDKGDQKRNPFTGDTEDGPPAMYQFPVTLKVGQTVLFIAHRACPLKASFPREEWAEDLVLLEEDDVQAVVEE